MRPESPPRRRSSPPRNSAMSISVVIYIPLMISHLAAGDVALASDAADAAWSHVSSLYGTASINSAFIAQAALARGDLAAARRGVDDAIAATSGWILAAALTTRARVAIAEGDPEQAERTPMRPLRALRERRGVPRRSKHSSRFSRVWPAMPAVTAKRPGSSAQRTAFASAPARCACQIYQAGYEASVESLRNAMDDKDFEAAWERVQRCRRPRRSPTRSAVVVNANGRRAVGHR